MSQAPHAVRNIRFGVPLGSTPELEDTLWVGLTDTYCKLPMALTAEKLASQYKISRGEVDQFALRSQTLWKKDESTFYRSFAVNRHNCNYYNTGNLHILEWTLLKLKGIIVWTTASCNGVLFYNISDRTMTGNRYAGTNGTLTNGSSTYCTTSWTKCRSSSRDCFVQCVYTPKKGVKVTSGAQLVRQNLSSVAVAAHDAGVFKAELAPVTVVQKKKEVVVDVDEHPKPQTTLEVLGKLPLVFKKDGVVTAGSASSSKASMYKHYRGNELLSKSGTGSSTGIHSSEAGEAGGEENSRIKCYEAPRPQGRVRTIGPGAKLAMPLEKYATVFQAKVMGIGTGTRRLTQKAIWECKNALLELAKKNKVVLAGCRAMDTFLVRYLRLALKAFCSSKCLEVETCELKKGLRTKAINNISPHTKGWLRLLDLFKEDTLRRGRIICRTHMVKLSCHPHNQEKIPSIYLLSQTTSENRSPHIS
ncbi:3-ketoacyl-CoA thiolase, mitochondrial [Homalodisca vitripennis]|nr:3-ketoacyl-CoA thiolase, mitochondrial [Homalodisca vitripennis]